MTEPRADGPTVRNLLTLMIEEATEAADDLECIARRGTTMDRTEIVRRALASQKAHLRAAVHASRLRDYLKAVRDSRISPKQPS